MTELPQKQSIRAYIAECVRILYWTYFKPFTFARWMREIDPRLHPHRDFLETRFDICAIPHLQRLHNQILLLNTVIPLGAVFLVGLISTFIIRIPFHWLPSSLFTVGWETGLLFSALPRFCKRRWEQIVLLVCEILVLLIALALPALRNVVAIPLGDQEAMGLAVGLTVGLPLSLVGSSAGSLALMLILFSETILAFILLGGLAGILPSTLLVGLVSGSPGSSAFILVFILMLILLGGLATNLAVGLPFGLAVSLAVGLTGSLAANLSVGVVFGMTGVLLSGSLAFRFKSNLIFVGIPRICFWLPELVWMFFLYLRSRNQYQESRALWLHFFPIYIDEIIVFPERAEDRRLGSAANL